MADINIENIDIKDIINDPIISKEDMKIYYENYFPYDNFFTWLGKDDSEIFERREFSFTMSDDRYFRFQCFKNSEELKKQICKLNPKKIDIGAIYNIQPNMKSDMSDDRQKFTPVQKEIVFDIDLTDYDDIRTCCSDAKVCDKCWKYMIVAYQILKTILEEDFGFNHILYAFSGRRGIHCWLCDERAKVLQNDGRTAIANFIKYKMINIKMNTTPGLKLPLHPSIERAIKIIENVFEEYILIGQDILNYEKGKILLETLIKTYFMKNYELIDNKIKPILNNNNYNSVTKFNEIKIILNKYENDNNKNNNKNKYNRADLVIKDFELNILYPRLDINVSKHINHLLKSPFCIHPKTGMVSVPLRETDIINFTMEKIPKLEEIIIDHKNGKKNSKFFYFKGAFDEFCKKLKNNQ